MRTPLATSLQTLALAGAVLLGTNAAFAADSAHMAVMGVHIAMNAPEVLDVLYAQGARDEAIFEHTHPCALMGVTACTDTISATLPGGTITVRFVDAPPGLNDGREAVFSVTYAMGAADGWGQGSGTGAGTWCDSAAGPAGNAGCPSDRARLAFEPGAHGAGTLTLIDSGLPARLGDKQPVQMAAAESRP